MTDRRDIYDSVVEAFSDGHHEIDGWVRRACPLCADNDGHEDTKESLGLNLDTAGFNCFRCGVKGRLPDKWREQLDLADMDFLPPLHPTIPAPMQTAEGYVPIFAGAHAHDPRYETARQYITNAKDTPDHGPTPRGMEAWKAMAMGVGAALTGPLAGRVIVPIPNYTDPTKPWQGWVARDYTGKAEDYSGRPRLTYRNPKGMSRELLFNEEALWVETTVPVFVVEGIFDTTVLYPNAVSCIGKPIPAHYPLLSRARRPVVVCLDGDSWEEGLALSWTLRLKGVDAVNIRLPPKTDPDEVELAWLMNEADLALQRPT